MTGLLVALQRPWTAQIDALLALGLPDHRGDARTVAIRDVLDRTEVAAADVPVLERFVDTLPERFAAIAACGLPDGLVHGDFHPGNVRGGGDALTLLDWGDCVVGNPLLDQPAFLQRVPEGSVAAVRRSWTSAWRAAFPGCDPDRAALWMAPVAAARLAVIYQRFLDRIEPSEHAYHRSDPALWLRNTAEILRRAG
jgi:Ser/Thr protein kinase RdoA (MazF antagonist)